MLFNFTTLTHYYRRYHEPETPLKDLLRKKDIDCEKKRDTGKRHVKIAHKRNI